MKKLAARGAVLGLWAVNAALFAAMADLAIESSFRGSALRFAVAGILVAYATFLASAGRRLDLVVKAGASLAVFAALLALSGWQTGSLAAPGGVIFAQHSADVVAAAFLLGLFVVVLATVAFAGPIAPWLRALCVGVLAYVALPLAAALVRGDGLVAALQSNAFLPSDPVWLRGSFVGVAFILPLLGFGCLLLASVWGARGRRLAAARLVASALVCALAAQIGGLQAANLGLPSLVAFEAPSSPAGASSAEPVSLAVASDDDAAIAPTVRAEAVRLRADPSALLDRVAAGIDNAVYDGAEQGAAGTLAAGAGNSVDKALLLSGLIRASDPAVQLRFATCTLPPDRAAQLIAAARAPRPTRRTILFQNAGELAGRAHDAITRNLLGRAAAMWQLLRTQARTETDQLASSLRQANVDPVVPSPALAESNAYAAHHAWLQVLRSGAWIDLDPTISPAAPGRARCSPDSVSSTLPAGLYATLTVRVKVEERSGSVLQSRYALQRIVRIADLAETNLSFAFAEPAGLRGASSQTATPVGMRAYTPLLRIGNADTLGQPILLPHIVPTAAPLQTLANRLDQVTGALSGPTASAAPSAPSTAPSEVTGAWLELSLATPSSPPEALESPLFDRVGFAARAADTASTVPLAPLGTADGEYLPLAEVWNIAVWTGFSVAGAGAATKLVRGNNAQSLFLALGRMQAGYYALRRALLEDAAAVPASIRTTRPSLSLLAFGFTPGATGTIRGRALMDVASDHTSAQGSDALTASASWAVASLLAERALVDGGAVLSGKVPPDSIAHADNDVLGIFDNVRQAQAPIEFLQPADASKAQALAASPEAQARVAARLAAGDAVLVPARGLTDPTTPNFGWWVINPTNGSIRDEMQNGRHQVEDEAVQNTTMVNETSPFLRRFGRWVAGMIACAAVVIPLSSGEGEGAEQAGEALHATSELIEEEEEIDECAAE